MKIKEEKFFWLGALFVFFLDQVTKLWVEKFLPFDKEYILNSFISIHKFYNPNVFLLKIQIPSYISSEVYRGIIVLISIILTFFIVWLFKQFSKHKDGWEIELAKTGLSLILGGIWGNAFDRIFRDYGVVDFIRLNMFKHSTPILNMADLLLLWGEFSILLAWVIILYKRISHSRRL